VPLVGDVAARLAERLVDKTPREGRATQREPAGQTEHDLAAAEAEREQAELVLEPHHRRLADIEADLVGLNEHLEQVQGATI
jgi:hypothetical protein